MSEKLEGKLKELVENNVLNPQHWATTVCKLTQPLAEDPEYETNPMTGFYPANSGSLNFNKAKIQKRKMAVRLAKRSSEPGMNIFQRIEKGYNEGKYFALLKNGEIAVAPDDVVAESLGLDADTPVDMFYRLMSEVCMRIQHNETMGVGPKKFSHWFHKGYEGGGGGPYRGAKLKPTSAPKRRPDGRGKKKARLAAGPGSGGGSGRGSGSGSGSGVGGAGAGAGAGAGVFDFPGE